jgi:hypothetical protein
MESEYTAVLKCENFVHCNSSLSGCHARCAVLDI